MKNFFHQKKIVNLKNSVSYEFYSILLEIIQNIGSLKKNIDISVFISTFLSKHKVYEGNAQHANPEFFRTLLNEFNYELNKANNKYTYMQINDTDENRKYYCLKRI